jgi:predicted nucleotidyltransferase
MREALGAVPRVTDRGYERGQEVAATLHAAVPWLVAGLAAIPSVERIVLFGSRARGDHSPCSDIDLAIEAPRAMVADRARMAALMEDAPTLLGIDLVCLDEADPGLRASVAREGIVLYERAEAVAGGDGFGAGAFGARGGDSPG